MLVSLSDKYSHAILSLIGPAIVDTVNVLVIDLSESGLPMNVSQALTNLRYSIRKYLLLHPNNSHAQREANNSAEAMSRPWKESLLSWSRLLPSEIQERFVS